MTEFLALISGAFLIGFATQTHCVGMCGPVIGILGINNSYKRVPAAILYNLGRITTYTFLGVVGGLVAASVSDISSIQYGIRYIAGGIMIFIALQLFGLPQFLAWVEKPFQLIWKPLQTFAQRFFPIKTALGTYVVGFIWGFLPCGAVYGPLAVAMGTGSVLTSASIMFAFGLGTLPMMLGLAIFGNYIGHFFAKKSVRMVAGLLILGMAGYYLGWIAPPEKVAKRAQMVDMQTEKIRTGETDAKDVLKTIGNMGGHKGAKSNAEHKMPQTMAPEMMPEMEEHKTLPETEQALDHDPALELRPELPHDAGHEMAL